MGRAANLAAVASNAEHHLGYRNRLINSDFRVDQYNNGASVAATAEVFVVDRFVTRVVGGGSAQRLASGLAETPFKVRLTGSGSAIAAYLGQYIESRNCLDLVGSPFTVSFYAAASAAASITARLIFFGTADDRLSSVSTQTLSRNITSTLTRYSVTFPSLPASVTNGLYVELSGSIGTGWIDFAALQSEEGSGATPLEFRDIGRELDMCNRHYVALANLSGAWPSTKFGFGAGTGTSSTQIVCPLPTSMRSVPDHVYWSGVSTTVGGASTAVSGIVIDTATASSVQVTVTGATYALGQTVFLQGGTLAFSAEI